MMTMTIPVWTPPLLRGVGKKICYVAAMIRMTKDMSITQPVMIRAMFSYLPIP